MDIARRSAASVSWNAVANVARIAILFVRSVILARLLPIETFGVYAGAAATVGLTSAVVGFGMGEAFLHRSPETADEGHAASVFFTLLMAFTAVWALAMTVFTVTATEGELRTALLVLILTTSGSFFTSTPRVILIRRVVHRRLALLHFLDAIVTTVAALTLAWQGATLWALLSTNLSTIALQFVLLYGWRPVWRPRSTWSPPVMRYFLGFGSRQFLATSLYTVLDRIDDLWTVYFLGKRTLGLYSRAYTFATYPRQILGTPINAVAAGTYAALKSNREQLSKAFFRTNALLVRSGFLLAGLLALVAPEFIRILLGPKWLPMLDIFRLMLVFTLLDPIKMVLATLFSAVGKPELVIRAQLIQVAVLVIGLFALGWRLGGEGVALAVDLMIAAGIGMLLWQARRFVDFSPARLFLAPAIALTIGLALARLAIMLPGILGSDWRTGAVKTLIFLAVYGSLLYRWERQEMARIFALVDTAVLRPVWNTALALLHRQRPGDAS